MGEPVKRGKRVAIEIREAEHQRFKVTAAQRGQGMSEILLAAAKKELPEVFVGE